MGGKGRGVEEWRDGFTLGVELHWEELGGLAGKVTKGAGDDTCVDAVILLCFSSSETFSSLRIPSFWWRFARVQGWMWLVKKTSTITIDEAR